MQMDIVVYLAQGQMEINEGIPGKAWDEPVITPHSPIHHLYQLLACVILLEHLQVQLLGHLPHIGLASATNQYCWS